MYKGVKVKTQIMYEIKDSRSCVWFSVVFPVHLAEPAANEIIVDSGKE